MSVTLRVDWQVTGSSYLELTDTELGTAEDAGIDVRNSAPTPELFNALDKLFHGDLRSDIVDNFTERDAAEVIQLDIEDEDGWLL